MFTSIDGFLLYFGAVNRRAVRDVSALPPEANGWRPATGSGEGGWDINTLVGHMAASRLYFASAYRGEGWIMSDSFDVSSAEAWVRALEESERRFRELVEGTPNEWLTRKIGMIDTDGKLSGWRILMMMLEHDIHHRSQIDTYAGINGWDVPQIYGRSAEQISDRRAGQVRKYRS